MTKKTSQKMKQQQSCEAAQSSELSWSCKEITVQMVGTRGMPPACDGGAREYVSEALMLQSCVPFHFSEKFSKCGGIFHKEGGEIPKYASCFRSPLTFSVIDLHNFLNNCFTMYTSHFKAIICIIFDFAEA